MSIDDPAELEGLQRGGAVVAATLHELAPVHRRLVDATRAALRRGMAAATAGAPLNAIGAAVERVIAARGFSVCADLTGHGIGRRIHEPPTVANVFDPGGDQPLTPGLVITVEPIVAAGRGDVVGMPDGWTVRTRDGSAVAHAEHTIVVTEGAPLVLTG